MQGMQAEGAPIAGIARQGGAEPLAGGSLDGGSLGGDPQGDDSHGGGAAAAPAVTPAARLRSRLQRVELGLIVGGLAATWVLARDLSWSPRCGALAGYAAAVLLAQGLVRDVARLGLGGRVPVTRRMRCLCAESTLGVGLLLIGLTLLLLGLEEPVGLDRARLTGGLGALLALGFVAKDYVLVIRREEDHGSIALG